MTISASVVFPDPEPPAIPMTRGVARVCMLELYWIGVKLGEDLIKKERI